MPVRLSRRCVAAALLVVLVDDAFVWTEGTASRTSRKRADVAARPLPHRDRLIFHPVEIYVDELDGEVLGSFEVILADGTREIVELR